MKKEEGTLKRYVIQSRVQSWDPWEVVPGREYDTLEEAKAALNEIKTAFDALPFKDCCRIAQAYVQVRYKAIKEQETVAQAMRDQMLW